MTEKTHVHPSDVHGLSRLAVEATLSLADLVEAMHRTISRGPGIPGGSASTRTQGITGLVYSSVRGVTHLVGGGTDAILARFVPLLGEQQSSPEREATLAALNGLLGDHLADTHNPLATTMQLRRDGQPLKMTRSALAKAIPHPGGKILLLVHGLCLNDRHWLWKGHDHGARLADELGYTPVYLRYNTGLHISTNGQALADLLEALLHHWPVPVEELAIIGHSAGGLVARSAVHYSGLAGHAWPPHLRQMVFLGTPHQGTSLERIGNWVGATLQASPYTAPLARLGKLRSAGITDLRYGSLLDEDWAGRDRFAPAGDPRQPVPLPPGVACYTVAATTGNGADDVKGLLLGDGLVPVGSALGRHRNSHKALQFPASRQWIGYGMNHLALLHRRDVYAQLRRWLVSQ